MITDSAINKRELIVTGKQLDFFNRDTNVKLSVKTLEDVKRILITDS